MTVAEEQFPTCNSFQNWAHLAGKSSRLGAKFTTIFSIS